MGVGLVVFRVGVGLAFGDPCAYSGWMMRSAGSVGLDSVEKNDRVTFGSLTCGSLFFKIKIIFGCVLALVLLVYIYILREISV